MRVKADPGITVGSLQTCFESFMTKMQSRDLQNLFRSAYTVPKFKMAPCPDAISSISLLLGAVLEIAPNGVLPRTRLAKAIESCHVSQPCNFTGDDTLAWSQQIGELLRVQCSHLRKLKEDASQRIITLKKASLSKEEILKHLLTNNTQILLRKRGIQKGEVAILPQISRTPTSETRVSNS